MALWLNNTNYRKEHGWCLLGLDIEAYIYKVKLFQERTVFELLWGYTDPFLEFLKNPPLDCPGQKGLSSFVQLQVRGGVKKKQHVFVLSLFCAAAFTESMVAGGEGGWVLAGGYTSYSGLYGEVHTYIKAVPFPGFRT